MSLILVFNHGCEENEIYVFNFRLDNSSQAFRTIETCQTNKLFGRFGVVTCVITYHHKFFIKSAYILYIFMWIKSIWNAAEPPQFSGIFSPATVLGYILIAIWPEVKKKDMKKNGFQIFKKKSIRLFVWWMAKCKAYQNKIRKNNILIAYEQ